MGLRHDARQWALQFLFQSEFNHADSLDEGIRLFWHHQETDTPSSTRPRPPIPLPVDTRGQTKARGFTEEIIRGVIAHHPDIDALIARHAENWGVERMGNIDRNALRIAVYEMLYRDDIPPVVSINEAVELAKVYSSTESGKFVNGILDQIRKELDRPARSPNPPPPSDTAE
ncbi:MAG: transcription antitermination factor NusB [Kiritimatiellae bacterium]|jgi:N utilization substance protein B|nr:transcription antitermination factor NusB [Kiritimatiellia bacterium]MDD4340626.1 transcription antitermination factor NusB [Kiritimatiellia bacterium]MDY0148530.1 transcription antitermination factor NusB [Kiritimatiellia bacterium]